MPRTVVESEGYARHGSVVAVTKVNAHREWNEPGLRPEPPASHDAPVKHGVAPRVLASQVAATAGWALEEGGGGASATVAAATIRDAPRVERLWEEEPMAGFLRGRAT